MNKKYYVIENLESKDFFLVLEYLNAHPSFSRDLDVATHYTSYELAEMVIKSVGLNGFNFKLAIRPLVVSYQLG